MKPLVLRKILFATDLGADTLPAMRTARRLAELWDAALDVVYAKDGAPHDADLDDRIREWVEQTGGPIDVQVLSGPAGALITQEAARTQADVIVLGRHRNRAGNPGSTADRVVRTAHVPCLILSQEMTLPLESVLVPVDVSEAARGELHVALTWASALRARGTRGSKSATRAHALYVRPDGSDDQGENARSLLRAEITAIRDRLADIAGIAIDEHVASGDIAPVILEQAEAKNADLIVLATRGTRIADDPLGSVSSAVVKVATRPVLLVPPEIWAAAGGSE